MICIYHNNDLDGLTSGAIVKRKYPDCKLIGWDYAEELPDFKQFESEEVIMIDVTFPIAKVEELRNICEHLTIIDHHVGFMNDFRKHYSELELSESTESLHYIGPKLIYKYVAGIAACEIGWKYLFPKENLPLAVKLLSEYDTWRHNDEHDWDTEILPFQYFMRLEVKSVEKYPMYFFENVEGFNGDGYVWEAITSGKLIIDYDKEINKKLCKFAFPMTFKGLRAICLNKGHASSTNFESIWDEEKYDLMMPFIYNGRVWKWSIYTTKDIDCSLLAKQMGGGGHKQASGFETKTFEEAFL